MSLISEKEETIKLVEQLNNIEVVRLIKKILTDQNLHSLELSMQQGLEQSNNNHVVAHDDVMERFKRKYIEQL